MVFTHFKVERVLSLEVWLTHSVHLFTAISKWTDVFAKRKGCNLDFGVFWHSTANSGNREIHKSQTKRNFKKRKCFLLPCKVVSKLQRNDKSK